MEETLLEHGDDTSDFSTTTAVLKKKAAWYRFRPEHVASFGIQFNYNNLSIALLILDSHDKWYSGSEWGENISSVLKSAVFVGSIFGMVSMGYVGDKLGLDRAFSITSTIMIVFALASAFAPSLCNDDNTGAMAILAVMRFGLGWGIGGCYPLSAAKSASNSNEEGDEKNGSADRNMAVGINLVWQNLGVVVPYAVAMVVVSLGSSTRAAVWQFRLMMALGALPPLVVLIASRGGNSNNNHKECQQGEPKGRFSHLATDSTEAQEGISVTHSQVPSHAPAAAAAAPPPLHAPPPSSSPPSSSFIDHVRLGFRTDPHMTRNFLVTTLGWFLYDLAYYGANQFTPTMTAAVFSNPQQKVYGFLCIASSCVLIACFWSPLGADHGQRLPANTGVLFGLYLFFVASTNWGPNMTTFVLPQEVFQKEVLATFNGIAAASGKLGAVAGIWVFEGLYNWVGMVPLMVVVAVLNVAGAWVSQVCISDDLWQR